MSEGRRSVTPLALPGITPAPAHMTMPIFEWVSPEDLLIDPSYQRDLSDASRKLIAKIISGWDWSRFKPPVAALADDGLELIDGQHTAIAAATHPDITLIPVMIVDLPAIDQRASAFIGHNRDRLAVSAAQLHHAAVTAGDEDALTVEQVCQRAGVRLLLCPPGRPYRAGETISVSSIKTLVRRRHAKRAREILEALVKAGRAPLSGNDIKAAELLLTHDDYAPEMTPESLTAAIIAAGPSAEQDAKLFAAAHKVPLWRALAVVWFRKKGKARKPEAA